MFGMKNHLCYNEFMMNLYSEKTVIIFDFDGTIYSGEHKFDNVPSMVHKHRRSFLPNITDEEYSRICTEFPNWNIVTSGKDIVDVIYDIKDKYPNLKISTKDFWEWQNEYRYDIIIDKEIKPNTRLINLTDWFCVFRIIN